MNKIATPHQTRVPFKPTPEMISAANMVFIAMAMHQTVQPVVDAYKRAILNEHQWKIDPKWTRAGDPEQIILLPKEAYLLGEADFAVYNAECFKARDAAKLLVDLPDQCPELVAEHHLSLAKNALIRVMEPTTGITAHKLLCAGMEKYQDYVDLTLRLLGTYCNPNEVLDSVVQAEKQSQRQHG